MQENGIQTPMAQGQSTKIISMIKWIRTSRLSMKNSVSVNEELCLGCRFHDLPDLFVIFNRSSPPNLLLLLYYSQA